MLMQLILFQGIFVVIQDGLLGLTGLKQWIYMNANFLPLVPGLFVVGGLIICTLSYVSWRKYKAEKQKTKQKKENIVD